ncbi:hypothetical protein [Peribacillus acanthi]|uniref:hypothetical protein n=1 Tax=Peribacillus acanthi TaxID=2171554 RepID=UPI000D3E97B4|nr:hypothetical protein [Peribacillus acanthi]
MEYLSHEEISYCTVFKLKLSQDEIEVYESCMKYVLDKCGENEIYEITGCKLDELQSMHKNLQELLLKHVNETNLPDKYKDSL